MMADLRRRIEQIIETDPVIQKGLQRRIVNSRALARYMIDVQGVDSTHDAILGIIRRYPVSDGDSPDDWRVFRECELSMRDKLADLKVEYHQETMYQIAEFASNLKTSRGENLKLVVGLGFIRIIADQNALENLRRTLRPREQISYSTNLTEISVRIPPTAHATRGIVAKIAMELALNDIELMGIVECAPELALVVAEADAPRTLEAIQMLREEVTNSKQTTAVPETVRAEEDALGEHLVLDDPTVEVSYPSSESSTQQAPRNSDSNRHRRLAFSDSDSKHGTTF